MTSLDAAVVNWGTPTAFPTPTNSTPDWSVGAGFMLWGNTWGGSLWPLLRGVCDNVFLKGTNYVMWWPWRDDEGDMLYRFSVSTAK